jgi:hypothetical protein
MPGLLTGIIGLLTLAGTIWWALYQRDKSPLEQNRDRYDEIDQDIAKGDSMAATAHADADLNELERLQNASKNNQRGPG